MTKIICFDTNMMIWGVRGMASTGQEEMVVRAKRYLEFLEKNKQRVIIPAPVFAEYLVFCGGEEREQQETELERQFRVMPYDYRAAKIAARISHDRARIQAIQEEFGKACEAISIDTQIVAIAAANKADVLIAHDGALRKLAEGIVTAVDIPSVETQATMFERLD